ncbi:MAG: hypothetical protein ABFS38_08790 [Bacteroidota bacterium]
MKLLKKRKLNHLGRMFFMLVLILTMTSTAAQQTTMADIKESLQSEYIEELYNNTYYSLLDRVDPDGFLQESLTGRYPGMFPRTVGGIVSLFIETGELDVAERIINCTLEAMMVNEMERIPHVFLRQKNDLIPVFNGNELMQSETSVALYKLNQNSSAAIKFKAPDQPIQAVEVAISLNACKGALIMTLRKDKESPPIKSIRIDAKQVKPGQLWHRFDFPEPQMLDKGKEYFIRFDFDGFGNPIWFGSDDEQEQGGAFWLNTKVHSPKWVYQKSHAPAYAIDIGNLSHKQLHKPYENHSDWDQIDGQAHVIMTWARLALERGQTDFENRTYELVAKLMDRTSDQPYFMCGIGYEVGVNLVQNIALEHSRESRYWHTWDILTQCVVGASLKSMIEVANQRGDSKHALRWQYRLQVLEKGIAQNLTRTLNGKKVYLEMLLPDSNGGTPFTGMGWLNFAPVIAQWDPLERQVLRNTVEALREKLLLDYNGYKYLDNEYDEQGKVSNLILGKVVGWELDYARQEKEYYRIKEWLDFLNATHSGKIYMEFMRLDNEGNWEITDRGNGEQCAWWCWAMARLRKEAGLSVVIPKGGK